MFRLTQPSYIGQCSRCRPQKLLHCSKETFCSYCVWQCD